MKVRMVFCALLLCATGAFSQGMPSAAQLQSDLVASWMVTVHGETRTRMLQVTSVTSTSSGSEVQAIYGWSDGKLTPVKAEVMMAADKLTLVITTPPGSKIVAALDEEGDFTGTFTPPSGQAKKVSLSRISAQNVAELRTPKVIPAGADVPPACAAFLGGWTGRWSGYEQRYLWITEVDANCVAKYSYGAQPGKGNKTVDLKSGTLTFTCGSSSGSCQFSPHGDELWGSYSGSDGTNQTVFRKSAPGRMAMN